MLFVADGVTPSLDVLKDALAWSMLLLQRTGEQLVQMRLVEIISGEHLGLTSKGRNFAMDNHLLGDSRIKQSLDEAFAAHRDDWMRR